MNITLILKDPNRQLAKGRTRMRLAGKRNFVVVGILLLVGLTCLVMRTPEARKKGFWTFESGIAVSAFFMAFFVAYGGIRIRRQAFAQYKAQIDRKVRMNDVTEMTIDDQGVRWHSQEISGEVKWSAFTHYKYYRQYILLYMRGEREVFVEFDPQDMRPEEFSELKQFLRSRLLVKEGGL